MQPHRSDTKGWMLLSIVCGLGAIALYTAIQLPLDLPLRPIYLAFMAFGPLLCLAILGLDRYLIAEASPVAIHAGALLMIAGGAINTVMAAMQGALRIYMADIPHGEGTAEAARAGWQMAMHAGNALQLGADMAWDVFMLAGLAIWGWALLRHPRFGPWFGWSALAIGAGGLTLNAWTFPTPPAAAGLVDGGPLVGLWFAAVTIRLIRQWRLAAA